MGGSSSSMNRMHYCHPRAYNLPVHRASHVCARLRLRPTAPPLKPTLLYSCRSPRRSRPSATQGTAWMKARPQHSVRSGSSVQGRRRRAAQVGRFVCFVARCATGPVHGLQWLPCGLLGKDCSVRQDTGIAELAFSGALAGSTCSAHTRCCCQPPSFACTLFTCTGTSAPAAEDSEEPSNPTPALPDDMMLRVG